MILANLALLLFLVIALNVSFFSRTRKRKKQTWEELVAALQPVTFFRFADALHISDDVKSDQRTHAADEVRDLLGGGEGLATLRANAEVMIALAAHVAHWNYEEAAPVCAWLHRDAIALRSAVRRVEIAYLCRSICPRAWRRSVSHLNAAASAYCLMRQRLLDLYENSHGTLYPSLAAAL
jgi:hypothetical protein